jgi:hypothetical protein
MQLMATERAEGSMAHREPEPQSHRARPWAVGTAAAALLLAAIALYLLTR